jgi:hypothetical protein
MIDGRLEKWERDMRRRTDEVLAEVRIPREAHDEEPGVEGHVFRAAARRAADPADGAE